MRRSEAESEEVSLGVQRGCDYLNIEAEVLIWRNREGRIVSGVRWSETKSGEVFLACE